jgi:hypothetical protein
MLTTCRRAGICSFKAHLHTHRLVLVTLGIAATIKTVVDSEAVKGKAAKAAGRTRCNLCLIYEKNVHTTIYTVKRCYGPFFGSLQGTFSAQ